MMSNLFRIIVLTCAMMNSAHGDSVLVESTNQGGGWFSYTFKRGDASYVWGISGSFGIYLQSLAVLEINDPPGWNHTVDSSGWISWSVTEGIGFLDEPVVFLVRSCLTDSATDRINIQPGVIAGSAYLLPARTNNVGGGYHTFEYVGPALPRLNIAPSGTNVLVQWSTVAEGLQLEASDQLGELQSWQAVTNAPAFADSRFTVELPATDQQKFFRLACPCAQGF